MGQQRGTRVIQVSGDPDPLTRDRVPRRGWRPPLHDAHGGLARRDPDGVVAALEPLFRARPDHAVYELDRRTAFLVAATTRPGPTLAGAGARASAALGVALTTKELRQLLLAYLHSPAVREEVPAHLLLRDLFRLRLISESPTSVELDADKRLVFRTAAAGSQRRRRPSRRVDGGRTDRDRVGPLGRRVIRGVRAPVLVSR